MTSSSPLDLLEGESVADLLRRDGHLTPLRAVTVTLGLLEVLAYVHERGVVHRDIKPGNVFLSRASTGAEVVKLIDFGAAKRLDDHTALPDALAQTSGTDAPMSVPFASPEQIARAVDLDARSDLWSVGVTLYRMLTGELPFRGPAPAAVGAIYTGTFEPASTRVQGVAPALDAVIQRALTPDRDARFATAAEMLHALRAVAEELVETTVPMPSRSPVPPVVVRTDIPPSNAPTDTLRPVSVPTAARVSARTRQALAALVVFALALGVGLHFFGKHEPRLRDASPSTRIVPTPAPPPMIPHPPTVEPTIPPAAATIVAPSSAAPPVIPARPTHHTPTLAAAPRQPARPTVAPRPSTVPVLTATPSQTATTLTRTPETPAAPEHGSGAPPENLRNAFQ